MRKPILKEVREHIKHPLYGDRDFGDWCALRQRQRDDIFRLCQYTESLEIVEEERRRVIRDYEIKIGKIRDYVNSTDFVYDKQYKKKDKIENILNGADSNEKI